MNDTIRYYALAGRKRRSKKSRPNATRGRWPSGWHTEAITLTGTDSALSPVRQVGVVVVTPRGGFDSRRFHIFIFKEAYMAGIKKETKYDEKIVVLVTREFKESYTRACAMIDESASARARVALFEDLSALELASK